MATYKLRVMKTVEQLVEEVLKHKDMSKAKLAALLKDKPQNFGKKLKRHEIIPVFLVEQISDALQYNLFNDLSKEWERKHFNIEAYVSEPSAVYGKVQGLEDYLEALIEKKVKERLRKP